jgi:hypothetical protein
MYIFHTWFDLAHTHSLNSAHVQLFCKRKEQAILVERNFTKYDDLYKGLFMKMEVLLGVLRSVTLNSFALLHINKASLIWWLRVAFLCFGVKLYYEP